MSISKLEKSAWLPYFNGMSKVLDGKRAEIEIDALTIGSQIEAEWVPLLGISYDPHDDIVDIILEGLDHRIYHPKELFIEQNAAELTSVEVVDGDDVHHIVKLRDPLMLPAPLQRQ